MAIKGQKFKHYPQSIKIEAIWLHEEMGWSYRRITEHFDIHDSGRVKVWVRKGLPTNAGTLTAKRPRMTAK